METAQDNNNTAMPTADEQQGGGFGPIIGILIVVALIAFGGLYFWGSKMMDQNIMGDEMMGGESFELLDTTVEDGGTITEEQFNALLEQAAPATGAADPTLDSALDDLGDLDALDAELDALGGQL